MKSWRAAPTTSPQTRIKLPVSGPYLYDLYWRSPESGEVWCKSWQLKKTIWWQLLLLHPARQIAAGGTHSAAITTDGVVRVWGRSAHFRLTNLVMDQPNLVSPPNAFS